MSNGWLDALANAAYLNHVLGEGNWVFCTSETFHVKPCWHHHRQHRNILPRSPVQSALWARKHHGHNCQPPGCAGIHTDADPPCRGDFTCWVCGRTWTWKISRVGKTAFGGWVSPEKGEASPPDGG